MSKSQVQGSKQDTEDSATAGLLLAINTLQKAAAAAARDGGDVWEFAVEVEHLLSLGATITELRQLRKQGLIEAAVENSKPGLAKRQFRKLKNLSFPARSCLIVTA